MNKKFIIILSIMVVLAAAYFIKADYYLTKSRYMADPLYCNSDSECKYARSGCGGCDYRLINIYSGEKRLIIEGKCAFTTDCYVKPSTATCENQICKLHSFNESCFNDCFDTINISLMKRCQKLCIQD